jgi:hypothetical protein
MVSAPATPQTSRFSSLIITALNLLRDNPPAIASHYSATIGRGKYLVVEREDVVSVNITKSFSLTGKTPIFPSGIYTVEVTKSNEKMSPTSVRIAVSGDGSWQSSLPMEAPGFYVLSIKDADGERRANLVILCVAASAYSRARQTFNAVKDRTAAWQGANAQADAHALLRAVLLAMSRLS